MLVGVGTDILSIERVRRCLDSSAFMQRTFTAAELLRGDSHHDPASYYAKVFAGKEAVFKCFDISADTLNSLRDIEIVDGDQGHPEVNLGGSLAELADSRGIGRVLLSVSYDTEYAIAFAALLERSG